MPLWSKDVEVAEQFDVHPNQITSCKAQPESGAETICPRRGHGDLP
jgi:hypothetical protein